MEDKNHNETARYPHHVRHHSVKSASGSFAANSPRKRVSSKFESLDYNAVESQRFLKEQESLEPRGVQLIALTRWFINFLIGAYVAVIAVLVAMVITYMSRYKLMAVYELLKSCDSVICLLPGVLVWMAINSVLVFVGGYLVTFHAPLAAGSGIPHVKCYLNGIRMPGLMSLKTLLAKAGGVSLSVAGGLACGKEGPMIHSGAICASGMASGVYGCGSKQWKPKCCEPLRTDEERRDFVAAGAASGVSAAFASPVGGVLFSLEEGASFLKQGLTWRMLFSSMTASLMLNIMMSALKGHPDNMSHPGLVSFGYLGDISFRTYEIPIFMLMAVFGGLSGALFIQLNYYNTMFRRRYLTNKWLKVLEAVLVAACSALIFTALIYGVPDCHPIRGFTPSNTTLMPASNLTLSSIHYDTTDNLHVTPPIIKDDLSVINESALFTATIEGHDLSRRSADSEDDGAAQDTDGDHHEVQGHDDEDPYGYHAGHGYVFQGFCPYGEHNRMADVLFKTGEGGLHAMLHAPHDEWTLVPLLVLFIVYHLLATWTYGLSVSSGVFIPSLLVGAVWGRMVGIIVIKLLPQVGTNIAKYALIGAACQLGGTVRMTISLTIIVIECTGDITFGIPIMLGLIIAKWSGDFFNPGIYDMHIEIQGVPLIPWEPPKLCYAVRASDMMSTPVIYLRTVETLKRISDILNTPALKHNGYPVVEVYDTDKTSANECGRLKGFIMRSQLQEIFAEAKRQSEVEKQDLVINEDEHYLTIDLRNNMDRSPYSVQEDVSFPKAFKLFRGLGLRHLVVVTDSNQVVGIITRINVARYRGEHVKGKFKVEELEIEPN